MMVICQRKSSYVYVFSLNVESSPFVSAFPSSNASDPSTLHIYHRFCLCPTIILFSDRIKLKRYGVSGTKKRNKEFGLDAAGYESHGAGKTN